MRQQRLHKRDQSEMFPNKLFDLLEDEGNASCISWNSKGNSVLIKDPQKLITEVLPKWFYLTSYASFIRQLSYYGFKKVGRFSLLLDLHCGYEHPYFQKGRRELLRKVTRQQKKKQPVAIVPLQKQAEKERSLEKELGSLLFELELCQKKIKRLEVENNLLRGQLANFCWTNNDIYHQQQQHPPHQQQSPSSEIEEKRGKAAAAEESCWQDMVMIDQPLVISNEEHIGGGDAVQQGGAEEEREYQERRNNNSSFLREF